MTVLLVDIGNSRIKWRTADAAPAFETHATADVAALGRRLADRGAQADVDRAIVSCVAGPAVLASVTTQLHEVWTRLAVTSVVPTAEEAGVVNGYAEPGRLGPDRWAALIGAHATWPADALLVCGFGTATTIDLLLPASGAAKARFVGGAILPGIGVMRRALATETARLDVSEGDVVVFADRTSDAIATGILMAQAGAVVVAVDDARRRIPPDVRLRCVLAGGDAVPVAGRLREAGYDADLVADLVLRGLAILATPAVPTL